ncbi:MAG TPA: hypothetical protein VE991_12560 [Acidimicrobiales bacterium]|nr:hypothetical protein [Acidimicrobiales bacterium]
MPAAARPARIRTPHTAYVDESRRPGVYLVTAALVMVKDVQEVTKAIREALPKGRRRAHFSAEGEPIRRQLLDCYCQLPVRVVVAQTEHRRGDDADPRARCLGALAEVTGRQQVRNLVIDTRGPDRDAEDRRTIAEAIRAGKADRDLLYQHRGSRDDLLLGLPDAFGWSYGAGGAWKAQASGLVVCEISA